MNLSTMLFSFTGRINRARYWLAVLAVGVVGTLVVVLGIALEIGRAYPATIAIGVTVVLALAWIDLAVSVKRLHDRDKSAWWLLLFYVVPAAILPAFWLGNRSANIILGSVRAGIGIWGFVEIACLRGTPGPNSHGSDPLQVQGAA
jgi:uncharacterized membrane protein YhaH (DUF805 family)